MPLIRPDAGVLRIQHDLQGPDVNRIDSGMFFTETLFFETQSLIDNRTRYQR